MNTNTINLERRLRHAFHKLGYSIRKSRTTGLYTVISDELNAVMQYCLDLDGLESFLAWITEG